MKRASRNSVGFDWNPINGKLYFTDNGRDWMGDMIHTCELNVPEEAGDFFGSIFACKNIKDQNLEIEITVMKSKPIWS